MTSTTIIGGQLSYKGVYKGCRNGMIRYKKVSSRELVTRIGTQAAIRGKSLASIHRSQSESQASWLYKRTCRQRLV